MDQPNGKQSSNATCGQKRSNQPSSNSDTEIIIAQNDPLFTIPSVNTSKVPNNGRKQASRSKDQSICTTLREALPQKSVLDVLFEGNTQRLTMMRNFAGGYWGQS